MADDDNTADQLTLTIRYTRANGTIDGATDRDNVTANVSDAGAERTITLKGTAAALNDYLDGVSFDPINTVSTATTFRFSIKDDYSPVQTINTSVTVTSTINGNAPPVIADVPTNIQTVPTGGPWCSPSTISRSRTPVISSSSLRWIGLRRVRLLAPVPIIRRPALSESKALPIKSRPR